VKNQSKTTFFLVILVSGIFSSTATLLIPRLWREITEAQAQKQALPIYSWAPLVERSQPAVVVIRTEAVVEQAPMEFPGIPGPFRFYMPMPPEKQQGQGSGFIINEDGYIITNEHVINGAQKIIVTVGLDAREYKAKLIGSDEPLDIALLKIEVDEKEKIKWPYLPLGDSDKLRLGDPVLALGSPLGLVQSVNDGIVSHKHRGGIRPSGRDLFAELIQLQMPINPGNSGGPILDRSGRVVGVSESIMSPQHGQAIAFSLPINIIKEMLPQLLAKGQVERAFLGVDPDDLTPQYAKELGLSQNEKGAVLVQVMPNTPAEKAGLKAMDVILEIDGQKVNDAFNLRHQTAYKAVGQLVNLKVFRKGEGSRIFKVKLEKRPGQSAQVIRPEKEISTLSVESVGLEVGDTPEQMRLELGLASSNPGAQVVGVMRRSSAEFAGLKPGDVITKVDNLTITSAKQLKTLIDKADKEKTFMMMTRRGNAERFVPLKKR
jgi:serine protease Do